jgi:hypothetical protein
LYGSALWIKKIQGRGASIAAAPAPHIVVINCLADNTAGIFGPLPVAMGCGEFRILALDRMMAASFLPYDRPRADDAARPGAIE